MKLRIIPLGGLGEIGLNMMIFEYGQTMVIVDAGLMFPEDYMLGVDYVIPDMEFIKENRDKISGIILTHSHEDHIGALPYLLKIVQVPVFGTPFTLGIVRHKLEEHDLTLPDIMHVVLAGEHIKIGPFEIECIRVTHSVADGFGLAIRTPLGLIVHTGDFKINHSAESGMITDVNRFAGCGQEGVLALLSDSTNVEKEGYTISAQQIGKTLRRIITDCPGRVIIALFASNITRIQMIVNIAEATGKKVIFDGKSIQTSVNIAKELDYLKVPEDIEITINEGLNYPDKTILMITTGSQGEPLSSLARMAAGTHKRFRIKADDTAILSSKFIPGNEKAIAHIINCLYRLGADVIYEKISNIHVSGHAFREELKLMINLTRPRYFIPIHGEYRHLVLHSRLAREVGIAEENILLAEDGKIIEFDKNGARIQGEVPTGRLLIDGKGVGDVGRSVLQERRRLSEEGLVVVNIVFDEETGVVVYGPELSSRGFVFATSTGHVLTDAQCVVLEIIEEINPDVPNRIDKIRSKMQKALRQYFFFAIGRRPVILPFLFEV